MERREPYLYNIWEWYSVCYDLFGQAVIDVGKGYREGGGGIPEIGSLFSAGLSLDVLRRLDRWLFVEVEIRE